MAPRELADVYEEVTHATWPTLRLIRSYTFERPRVVGIAIVSTALWRVLGLVPPYLLGVGLDTFFTGGGDLSLPLVPQGWIPTATGDQFLFLVDVFVASLVVQSVFHATRYISWRWIQQHAIHDLRMDTFGATQDLGYEFFASERTGNLLSVLNNDVNEMEEFLSGWVREVIEYVATVTGLAAAMVWLHWQLSLITLVTIPPILVATRIYQRRIEPRHDERRSAIGELNARMENAIGGIATVKAFTAEDREREAVAENSTSYREADIHASKIEGVFFPIKTFLTHASGIAIFAIGGWWALFGPPFGLGASLSVGTFVTFYLYGRRFVGASQRVSRLVDQYTEAKASAKRILGLVHHPGTIAEAGDAGRLDDVAGSVQFEDVTFRYPGGEEPSIWNVSFEAEPGGFVGLVGPTGAGKTTLLRLLLRFYDPDEGTIRIDGTDVSTVTVRSLREAIGYVSQEPFLFDASVRENIAYGDPDATEEEIRDAARRANAHEFVSELTDGYETRVGERGVKLSGGQRQRIAIARVVLADPAILLLDEATSHVDNRTELLIRESLEEIVADRTTFAIAHQLSTVRAADQLLVLQDGEVVERGTHDELLAEEGLYATLWDVHVGTGEVSPDLMSGRD